MRERAHEIGVRELWQPTFSFCDTRRISYSAARFKLLISSPVRLIVLPATLRNAASRSVRTRRTSLYSLYLMALLGVALFVRISVFFSFFFFDM